MKSDQKDLYALLIVEDELLIAKGLARTIPWETFGFCVANVVSDGMEAKQLIQQNEFDAVLADIAMPNMSGLELTQWVRQKQCPLEIVLLTGYGEFEYARQAILYDVFAYLLKPVNKEEIADTFCRLRQKMDGGNQFRRARTDTGRSKDLPGQAHDFIDINYMHEINLNLAAERLGANASYLSRVFEQRFGIGFTNYLNSVRLKHAQELLMQSNLSVREIAQMVGYSSERYFRRLFSERMGLSPTAFRQA